MLNIARGDVTISPFPHVVKQEIIDSALFDHLRVDFPDDAFFADQNDRTGAVGSRVGKGTGFDIYRGDKAYDQLITRSEAWREFDTFINSRRFVELFLDLFGPDLPALGCKADVDPCQYDRSTVEPREVLRAKPTFLDRVRQVLPRTSRPVGKPGLFTRLDIERSKSGYSKPPHCDRANRLASLIIYFTDMEAEGIEGGELNLYRHKRKLEPNQHERHPRPEDVDIVATLRPTANLGVFFPCSNNSYHGVNATRTIEGTARDFLYINISAVTDCW